MPPKSKGPGGARAGAGRPRRHTLSEKEILEKARSRARQNADAAMEGYVEQLKAMKTVFWQGTAVCDVTDWQTRQVAQDAILEATGLKKPTGEFENDPFAAFMREVLDAVKSGKKPAVRDDV